MELKGLAFCDKNLPARSVKGSVRHTQRDEILLPVRRALIHMNALRFANEVSFVTDPREPMVRSCDPGDGRERPTDR